MEYNNSAWIYSMYTNLLGFICTSILLNYLCSWHDAWFTRSNECNYRLHNYNDLYLDGRLQIKSQYSQISL